MTGQQEDTEAQSPGLGLDDSEGLSQFQWPVWNQLAEAELLCLSSFSPST